TVTLFRACVSRFTNAELPREPHYRSGPKSLSINRRSGRIWRRILTGSSNVVQSHHNLTSLLDDTVERRAQGSVAALFDVDNTLLPGVASEVRFFRFLWRRGLVGWSELSRSVAWLAGHVPPFSLHSLREQKVYLRGKRELILAHAHGMGLDLAGSYAYGDSPGDRDILELVGYPLVVNPIRGMARTARRLGWPVTTWE